MLIKKDPTTTIRKPASELKVHEKTVKTAIKQFLSPDLKLLGHAIWSVLENKRNATSHPNIGSLKTAMEEWNKISKEFIFKACKSFQSYVHTNIEIALESVYYYTRLFLILLPHILSLYIYISGRITLWYLNVTNKNNKHIIQNLIILKEKTLFLILFLISFFLRLYCVNLCPIKQYTPETSA